MHKTLRSLFFPLFIVCSTLIVGCGSSVPVIRPFKMDIQQGNVVTSKMLLQLRPGMTKSQVKFIMGTPLVVDSFHTNRWDYFYQLRHAGKVVEQRRVILDFEKDLLARVRGDVVPQGTPGADTGAVTLSKEPLPATVQPAEKEGVFENLKFWRNRETPKNTETPKNSEAIKNPGSTQNNPELIQNNEVQKVKPVVAPVVPESKPAESSSVPEALPATETPSLLIVPMSIGPNGNNSNENAPAESEPSAVQPKQTKPIAPPEKITPAETAPIESAPIEAAPSAPASNAPAKSDDEAIFRLDKKLNTKDIEAPKPAQNSHQQNVNKPSEKAVKESNKLESKPITPEPAAVEEEPGYFERMLEKIGF